MFGSNYINFFFNPGREEEAAIVVGRICRINQRAVPKLEAMLRTTKKLKVEDEEEKNDETD